MFKSKPRNSDRSPFVAVPEVHAAIASLDKLMLARRELASPSRLLRELLPRLFRPDSSHSRPVINADAAAEMLAAGVPALRGQSFEFAEAALAENWSMICSALMGVQPVPHAESAPKLADAVRRGAISLCTVLGDVLSHGPNRFREQLAGHGLDSVAGLSVLRLAALPVLSPIAKPLEVAWQRSGWARGYCPACGSWPALAELRGLEQFRWLRCGLCNAGWQVDRLFCPFCETRDHEQLHDLFVQGQEQRLRVGVCDACRGFVRSISTLTPLSAPGIVVAELETLDLELIATDRGYSAAPPA